MDPNPEPLVSPRTAVVVENAARIAGVGNIPHAILPPDYSIRDLERTQRTPARERGDFAVLTADAFTRQVKLLRKPEYHLAEAVEEGKKSKPAEPVFDWLPIYFVRHNTAASIQAVLNHRAWRDLTVTLAQKLSDPFSEWLGLNKVAQNQRAFALFLEERTHHVLKPEGAKLLELARKFRATTTARFMSNIDDASATGDVALEYIVSTQAGTADARNSMKVPERITLLMPIWHGGEPVKFEARLSYSTDGGRLVLAFEILQLNALLSETLRALAEKIAQEHPQAVLIEGTSPRVPALSKATNGESE